MSKIYKHYKRRLIEISGKNRSIYAKRISGKYSYDLGALFAADEARARDFIDFLWTGKRTEFEVSGKSVKDLVYNKLKAENTAAKKGAAATADLTKEEAAKQEKALKQDTKKALLHETSCLIRIKRETEDFERETGRYELYVGYPFVQGYIGRDLTVKAPLILFPVTINSENESSASLELLTGEPIKLNKVLLYAYATQKRIDADELETDFTDLRSAGFKTVADVIDYLKKFDIHISYSPESGLSAFDPSDPKFGSGLRIRNFCVLGRFPLTNSIYNDYEVLEKKKLTTPAIEELLFAKRSKTKKKAEEEIYPVSRLDYAQLSTIEKLDKNSNMVIYGPPGTGKSQTIVNAITDALAKGRKVLVVSQKKAALEVVYNRLAGLNRKAMMITDSDKSKAEFYLKAKNAHDAVMQTEEKTSEARRRAIAEQIKAEVAELQTINDVLFTGREYGLTLQQMYANSEIIGKNSRDYIIFQNMRQTESLMKMTFPVISEAQKKIVDKKKDEMYFRFLEEKQENPLIDYVKSDIDIHTLGRAQNLIAGVLSKKFIPFDMTRTPYARDVLAYYLERGEEEDPDFAPLARYLANTHYPELYRGIASKHKAAKKEKEIESTFKETLASLKEYIAEYEVLKDVLVKKGYLLTVDNVVSGNTMYLKLLSAALTDYVYIRDMNACLKDISAEEKAILKFAYKNAGNYKRFKYIVDKIVTFRTYNEVILLEEKYKKELSRLAGFANIKNRILSLTEEELEIDRAICYEKNSDEYRDFFWNNNETSKNFLYQISKQQNLWPIRKCMHVYKDYFMRLFPCFLLSPEIASQILPLEKEMFDYVIFDEASQVFVENTLPCIFRGKHIVVAGDGKQLRPSATFLKRYMGNEDIEELDYSTQAALEVESLLDLATSRYESSNLTYHYRSRSEALINFSNYAFYGKKLQIAPDLTKNAHDAPIERIKVCGRWLNMHNEEEAKAVAELLRKLLTSDKKNGSIGIITFNAEQKNAIEDEIDDLAKKDPAFHDALLLERNRKENGEDVSLFVKNLENVQGDERDIVIFSTGYAQNEYGKVVARFGLLSNEGGENRLNVAITRAKRKIYVVTGIEPEELSVAGAKNMGPKLFKEYLKYVRAVSEGNKLETKIILENLFDDKRVKTDLLNGKMVGELEEKLKEEGYCVERNVGDAGNKLPLAVYDEKDDKYLIGIEFDYSVADGSDSILERDVYHPSFMESRGWNIYRVWSRDWWLNKSKVVNAIKKEISNARGH